MRLRAWTLKRQPRGLWIVGTLLAVAVLAVISFGSVIRAEDTPKPVDESADKKETTTETTEDNKAPKEIVQQNPGQETGEKAASTPKPVSRAPRTTSKSSSEVNLVNREVYVYKTVGRRDPFASLLEGEFETTVGHPLLDVSSMRLVGVVWGKTDKFALIEDGRGHGHILRVGDPVINGYVVGLTENELLIRQSSYGESQTVTIQLQRKEGGSNAR